MKSPKLILPVIVAMLLSIGIISYVSAEETAPYLQKLFGVFGISENSDSVEISVYDSELEDFASSMEISPNKVSVSGELCLNDKCVENLAWNEIGNSVYFDGGVGIGADEEGRNAYVTIQNKGITGVGLWSMTTSNGTTLTLTPDTEKPAEFGSVAVGDTMVLKINNADISTKVTNKTTSEVVVEVIAARPLSNQSQSSKIEWSYVPEKAFSIKNSNGDDVVVVVVDEGGVRVSGKFAPEELCLASGCIEAMPENIWEKTGDQHYTTANSIETQKTLKANLIEVDYMTLPKNFIETFHYETNAGSNLSALRMTPVNKSICFLTKVITGKGDHNRKCTIESSNGFWELNALQSACAADCITNSLPGIEGCKAFGGAPRNASGQIEEKDTDYVMCEFTGSECPQNWQPYITTNNEIWVSGEENYCFEQKSLCSKTEATSPGFALQKVPAIKNEGEQVRADLSNFSEKYQKKNWNCEVKGHYDCYPLVKTINCKAM